MRKAEQKFLMGIEIQSKDQESTPMAIDTARIAAGKLGVEHTDWDSILTPDGKFIITFLNQSTYILFKIYMNKVKGWNIEQKSA